MNKKILLDCLLDAANKRMELPFYREYYDVNGMEGCTVALSAKNRDKNFDNEWGFPYDDNMITSIGDYINASPMTLGKHRYIAAQGPRKESFNDFWNMVWAENCSVIATVTNEEEKHSRGMIGRKFDKYWPEKNGTYGTISIELLEDELLESWEGGSQEQIRRRKLSLTNGSDKREITHLQLENWFDNDVVRPESLHQFSMTLDRYHNYQPIVVHCAAGIGRTGTLIAYHSLYHDIQEAISQGKPPLIDVPARVKELRSLRWGAIVASRDQYDLVVTALEQAISWRSKLQVKKKRATLEAQNEIISCR